MSLAFDTTRRVLFLSDSGNHAVRRVSLSGAVSNVWGRPDMRALLLARGLTDEFDRTQVGPDH